MKKTIDLEELKQLQLDVLVCVGTFCREHGIRYSMGCGTLLGAARHQGYIPWDDDIDIYVPREDYQKLISEFPETYKGKIKIASLERDKQWGRAYAKAYDCRTVMVESGDKFELGVNIDVFPVDDVPDDETEWLKYDRRRRMLQNVYSLRSTALSSERALWKNMVIVANRIATGFLSRRRLAGIISSYAQKHNEKGYGRCFETIQGIFQKKPFSKKLFNHLVDMPFEDKRFLGFQEFDKYLTAGYGDWRQLPPEEKRISHHKFEAWWKE